MSRKPKLLKAVLVAAAAAAGVIASAQGYVPHRVLLKFAAGTPTSAAQAALASVGARLEREMPQLGIKVLQLPANANEQAVANALAHKPGVQWAELDELQSPAQVTPNDPRYSYGWHLSKISAQTAWATTTGSSSVIIAILDTGCDGTHEDLSSKMVPGWNVYSNNSDTSDVYGHGTPVAGTAAAATNNALGVSSIAWGCKIMPIRISDASGVASWSTMASGLTWAADHGARVANISFSGTDGSSVQSAAQYFMSKGGVVTVAAGNDGTTSTAPMSPYMLNVSATDQSDLLASFSNRGSNIAISAPGMYIYTTNKGNAYGAPNGTSFSAPIVAGVAALVMSANPALSGGQVQQLLKDSADDLGDLGWDPLYGWGRVNAARAVAMAVSTSGSGSGDTTAPTASFSQPSAGMTLQGTFPVSATASDNVGVVSMTLSVDGVQVASSTTSSVGYSWNTLNVANGDHQLTVTAKDAANNVGSQTLTVSVYNVPDTTPPSVAISSPTGGTVGNSVSVSVGASDNVGVTKVELYLDGKLVSTDTSSPWSFSLNSRKWAKGSHTLQAKAYDAANNSSVSPTVTVTK